MIKDKSEIMTIKNLPKYVVTLKPNKGNGIKLHQNYRTSLKQLFADPSKF